MREEGKEKERDDSPIELVHCGHLYDLRCVFQS
jgi:hypothetical protein